jgi:hypothetical protein
MASGLQCVRLVALARGQRNLNNKYYPRPLFSLSSDGLVEFGLLDQLSLELGLERSDALYDSGSPLPASGRGGGG